MSNIYNPDKWEVIQIGDHRKVLAGWSGGYLDGDSWKLSSAIKETEETEDMYIFNNHSGSTYKCHKKARGFTVLSGSIYEEILQAAADKGVTAHIVDEEGL